MDTTTAQNVHQPEGFTQRNRMMLKALIICAIILLLLIPIAWVQSLVGERSSRMEEVAKELSNRWGDTQSVCGPVLMLPYTKQQTVEKNKIRLIKGYAFLLPKQLNAEVEMEPNIRHRSLFDIVLYRSKMNLSGSFDTKPLEQFQTQGLQLNWAAAQLLIGVQDLRGMESQGQMQWAGKNYVFNSAIPENNFITTGVGTSIEGLAPNTVYQFNTSISLRGSQSFFLKAAARQVKAHIASPWKDPSFAGYFMPNTEPVVNDKGFKADWEIPSTQQSIPDAWLDKSLDLKDFGVKFLQPTGSYQKTTRAVKYAILFIALTFSVFFLLEIFQRKQVHPIQYTMVGFALCIFYALLLSISEYLGFNPAYLIAALATVLLIGTYVRTLFQTWKVAAAFIVSLTGLYLYIFTLIQLNDYALLIGSIGLFLILALMMFITRKINWYHPQSTTEISAP